MKRLTLLFALLQAGAVAQALPPPALDPLPQTAVPAAPRTSGEERSPAPDGGAEATAAATPAAPPSSSDAAPPYAARLRTEAQQVLAGPEFRQRQTVGYPVPRDWLRQWFQRQPREASTPPDIDLTRLAQVFQALAVLVLALALAWLLWRGWQWLAPRGAAQRPRRGTPVTEARSLALPDTPLPEAITAAARAAWLADDAALALSLLYRGAVRDLARHHRIELPDSATEGECLRQARRSGAAVVATAFAPIVQAWMALAYARRLPANFDALLALYERHFPAPSGDAP